MLLFKDVKYKDILNIETLKINKHTVTSIVGQSGSGKTTLLRLLNKLISCDSGEIFYKDKPLSTLDSIELRREIVMLPQEPAIFKGSVKDNLLVGLKFSEKPPAGEDELNEILDLVQLDKKLEQDAEKLSGGERQRLALGRIILMRPEVYLLDEPSSALDEYTEQLVIEELVKCTKRNKKTLVMVTHSNKIAKQFSNVIIELKNGRVFNQEEV